MKCKHKWDAMSKTCTLCGKSRIVHESEEDGEKREAKDTSQELTRTVEDVDKAVRDEKIKLLEYLISIAQFTTGMEVWRALFSEMLYNVKENK